MKLKIEEVEVKNVPTAGDVVVFDDGRSYILMEARQGLGQYELRSPDGRTGACGVDTLEEIAKIIAEKNAKVYDSNSYELVLRKKYKLGEGQ